MIIAESMAVLSQGERPAAVMHRSPSGHGQAALYATRPAQNPSSTLTLITLGSGRGHKAPSTTHFHEAVTLLSAPLLG